MKKPIDPNLDSFDNEELPLGIDNDEVSASVYKEDDSLKNGENDGFSLSVGSESSANSSKAEDFTMREKHYHHHSS